MPTRIIGFQFRTINFHIRVHVQTQMTQIHHESRKRMFQDKITAILRTACTCTRSMRIPTQNENTEHFYSNMRSHSSVLAPNTGATKIKIAKRYSTVSIVAKNRTHKRPYPARNSTVHENDLIQR